MSPGYEKHWHTNTENDSYNPFFCNKFAPFWSSWLYPIHRREDGMKLWWTTWPNYVTQRGSYGGGGLLNVYRGREVLFSASKPKPQYEYSYQHMVATAQLQSWHGKKCFRSCRCTLVNMTNYVAVHDRATAHFNQELKQPLDCVSIDRWNETDWFCGLWDCWSHSAYFYLRPPLRS